MIQPIRKKIESRKEVLENAKRLYTIRNEIIEAFKDCTFFMPEEAVYKYKTKDNEDNKQLGTIGMPDLETEESAEQRRNKKGQGIKILTPEQMVSRLPIFLAQLKAGNNSEKLKNEIRQLLYSFCR